MKDDIGSVRIFKRNLVRDKSVSQKSNRSSTSSLRSSGRQSLDKESLRNLKKKIQDEENSVIEMYYTNLDGVIHS